MYFSLWLLSCLGALSNILLASENCHFPSYSPNFKYSQTGVKQIKRVKIQSNQNISDSNITNLSVSITFYESLKNSQLNYAVVLRNLYDINPQNGLSISIRVSSVIKTSLNLQIRASEYNDITLLSVSYLLVVKDESLQSNLLILQNVRKFQSILQISKKNQTIWLNSLSSPISTNSNVVSWLSGISIEMTDSTIQLRTTATLINNSTVKFTLTTYQTQISFLKEVSYTIIVYNPSELKQAKIKFQIQSGILNFSPASSDKMQLQAYQFNIFLGIISFAYKTSDSTSFGFEIINKTSNLNFYYTSYYNEVPYLIIKSYYCPYQYKFYYAPANSCLGDCPLPAMNNIVDLECDGKVSVDNSSCDIEDSSIKTFIIAFSISFAICSAIGAYFIYNRCKNCNGEDKANQEDNGIQQPKNLFNNSQNQNKLKIQGKVKNGKNNSKSQGMASQVSLKKPSSLELKRLSSQSDKLSPFKFPDIIPNQQIQPPMSEGCDSMQNIPC